MQPITRFMNGFFSLSAALGLVALAPSAQAQDAAQTGSGIAKSALGFLNTGAYFITGNARRAIGSTKFYNEGAFYVRPKHIGNLALTGGVDIIGASDHFLPFSGRRLFQPARPRFPRYNDEILSWFPALCHGRAVLRTITFRAVGI